MDIERRLFEHNNSDKLGSKYVRARRPAKLVYFEVYESKIEAQKREYAIKRLSRKEKLKLIQEFNKQKGQFIIF
jgi:putative endonuclease